jgi:hypothetical protein
MNQQTKNQVQGNHDNSRGHNPKITPPAVLVE